jgi:hypothetical protein
MPDTDTAEPTTVDGTDVETEPPAPEEDLAVEQKPTVEDEPGDDDQADEGDTFPRSYVVKLRSENARYRERARNADAYAKRLHVELVRATGKLADPSDLETSEDHLDDPDALAAAIDDLLARKPHLASRRPTGERGRVPHLRRA